MPFLKFHCLLPKVHRLRHPATSHNIHSTGKIQEQRETKRNQTSLGLPRCGERVLGLSLLLSSLTWGLFLPQKVIKYDGPLGDKTFFIFVLQKIGVLTMCTLLAVT
jgi:hypothetical protein